MGAEPNFADYAALQDYLFSLKAQGVKFGIDRMRLLRGGHREPRARGAVRARRRDSTARALSRRCSTPFSRLPA